MQHLSLSYKVNTFLQSIFLGKTKLMERLAARHDWVGKVYLNAYMAVVQKEIKMAKIEAKTKVLHIGGGVPYTATLIAKMVGAAVVVLEIDQKTASKARRWVKKYGYEDQIEIVVADGASFSARGFDIIIISLSVSPKEAIFFNVISTSDSGARIIYRSAKKSLETIYCDKELLAKCRTYIKQTVHQRGVSLKASHLIVKDEASAPL
ncbi:hypothetical protein M1M97_00715 [Thermodesulfovibrionales bacterium]|nr:hypothetical protein [Thermodesulfovibrionales bacterium]MCL0051187.1 hypothetical protein [Thermodesulfovibrionales bacterium]